MNFLNSIVLFGLGAAALPIIIHLLFKRRARDVPFPSIKLLEKMRTDRIRRLRIKQLLVLIMRILIIILVVLAFARPALKSVFRQNARTSAVIVIDGSASMQYIHNGELLFNRALRKTREIIDMLDSDDSAAVILSAGEPNLLGTGMTSRKKELIKALDNVESFFAGSDVISSFNRAVKFLNSSGAPNREMYYLTDGALNTIPDSLDTPLDTIRLYTVLLGPEKRESAVVENLELVNRMVNAGRAVTFRARGLADNEDEDVTIELFVNGERKGRTQAEKRSAGRITAEFEYTPENHGRYSVYATVNDGRFECGETRRIVMHVPPEVTVLISGASPQDLYFLEKALEPESEQSIFAVRAKHYEELIPDDITMADVIVLSGVPSLPDTLYRSIRSAVMERGAGLIVFPPGNMESSLYENGIFRDISPLTVEKYVTLGEKETGGFELIDWFNMNHPVLKGVSQDGKFLKPEVRSYFIMRPSGIVTVIARFSGGSMAIGDSPCGKGRAVVFAVDATSASSELPVTGIFVPLFIRTVQYLSGAFVTGGSYESGESIIEVIGDVESAAPVSIKSEDGPTRSVTVTYSSAGAEIKGVTAGSPGFYSVYSGADERSRFSVDIPLSEIFFQRADNTKMAEAYKNLRWKTIDGSEDLTSFVASDRYGTELFSLFIILAIVAIGIEMGLSRKL